MPQLVIRIDIDNAAFEDSGPATEVARILRKLADDTVDTGEVFLTIVDLRDINGNVCGHAYPPK